MWLSGVAALMRESTPVASTPSARTQRTGRKIYAALLTNIYIYITF